MSHKIFNSPRYPVLNLLCVECLVFVGEVAGSFLLSIFSDDFLKDPAECCREQTEAKKRRYTCNVSVLYFLYVINI